MNSTRKGPAMAKAKTAVAPKAKKKAVAKPKPAAAKAKTAAAKPKKARAAASGFPALAKLVDHPLIADLLAVGAMAAVAAIAEDGFSGKDKGKGKGKGKKSGSSAKAVKAAGKAAAAAIGKRLLTEVEQIKKASKPASK